MTWRLGPQVAVLQKAGVANRSAVGLPDASAWSRLIWYIAGSGFAPEESCARLGTSLTVSVLTEIAGWPMLGTDEVALTSSRSRLLEGVGCPESRALTSTPQLPGL